MLGVGIGVLLPGCSPTGFGALFTSFTMVIVGAVIARSGLDRAVVKVAAAPSGRQAGRATAILRCLSIRRQARWSRIAARVRRRAVLTEHVFHSPIVELAKLTGGWLIAAALQSLMVETFQAQGFSRAAPDDALLVDILLVTTFGVVHASDAFSIDIRGAVGIAAGVTVPRRPAGRRHLVREIRAVREQARCSAARSSTSRWPSSTNVAIYFLGSGFDLPVSAPSSRTSRPAWRRQGLALVATPVDHPGRDAADRRRAACEEAGGGSRTRCAPAPRCRHPSLGIFLVFVLFGAGVMEIVYGKLYRDGSTILVILSIGRLVAVWSGAAGITLMMTGHQRSMMVVTLCTGALSVAAGIWAADRHGAVGVATATASVAVLQNVLQVALARRYVGCGPSSS